MGLLEHHEALRPMLELDVGVVREDEAVRAKQRAQFEELVVPERLQLREVDPVRKVGSEI